MKDKLVESKYLDYRIKPAIMCVLTVSYGGLAGFDEAIAAAASQLSNIELVEEQNLLKRFFSEIAQNTGLVCYGPGDTFLAQQMGALETLIISEQCQVIGNDVEWTIRCNDPDDDDESLLFEYVLDNSDSLSYDVKVVSDLTPEGTEFLAGFGGIGGFLRWKVDLETLADSSLVDVDDDEFDSDEFM